MVERKTKEAAGGFNMEPIIMTILSVWISFFIGCALPFLLGRGLFGLYLKALMSGKIIVRIHLNKGGAVYRLATPVEGGAMVAWTLYTKKDVRYTTVAPGAIIRSVRVRWCDVAENDTAPFRYDKVIPYVKETVVPVEKDSKETKTVRQTAYRVFEGWNDNSVIRQLYQWALLRPRRKLPGLGMDLKGILVVLAVVVGVILFIMQIKTGTAGTAGNVIG